MTSHANRRVNRRIALLDDFRALDSRSGELLGYLRDISLTGLMIVGAVAPPSDGPTCLAIVLPEPIAGVGILQVEATCRWHTFDAERKMHKSGFQFGELSDLNRQILEQIKTEYEFSVCMSGS